MIRANGSDRRFCSAAVFAPHGKDLKAFVQPTLSAIGWTRPTAWRAEEFRNVFCDWPPSDYSPWTLGPTFLGDVFSVFTTPVAELRESLSREAIAIIRDGDSAFRHVELRMVVTSELSAVVSHDSQSGSYALSVLVRNDSTSTPSARLLELASTCRVCECYPIKEGRAGSLEIIPSLTPTARQTRLQELRTYKAYFKDIPPEPFFGVCDALKVELFGSLKYASFSVRFDPVTVGDLFAKVSARVPAYFFSGFHGEYRKGFDPYARPAAADAGETVRYPLVSVERPRLSQDGDKDIHIDIVHRPQGDCYFDLQVVHHHAPDDTCVRKTLEDAIKPLEVKAEIWDGDPFLRWQ